MEAPREIKLQGWRFTLARVLIAVILALAALGAVNLACALFAKADYSRERYSPELYRRLYKERQKFHGLDRRFHTVWEKDGQYYFKDAEGRMGRFI
jgi:hypothetical protein